MQSKKNCFTILLQNTAKSTYYCKILQKTAKYCKILKDTANTAQYYKILVLKVTEDIRLNLEDGQVTVLVMLDFTQAFDMTAHDFMVCKMWAS
jgi:hypothetical protein